MKRAFTLIELMIVVAIIAILASLIVGAGAGCSRSEGSRAGALTKFSYKGILTSTKSYEGELALQGLASGAQGSAANIWKFSVWDTQVAAQLEALVGSQVKLRYKETAFYNPFRRSTSYLVTKVEPVAPSRTGPER